MLAHNEAVAMRKRVPPHVSMITNDAMHKAMMQEGEGFKDILNKGKELIQSTSSKLGEKAKEAGRKLESIKEDVSREATSVKHGLANLKNDQALFKSAEKAKLEEIKRLKDEIKGLIHWHQQRGLPYPKQGIGYPSKLINDFSDKRFEAANARMAMLNAEAAEQRKYLDLLKKSKNAREHHAVKEMDKDWFSEEEIDGFGRRGVRKSMHGIAGPVSLRSAA